MNVTGLGTDLVAVPRVARLLERHRDRFLVRCFRPGELEGGGGDEAAVVSGCWAAKEALLKALGADVRHIPYRDVEVRRLPTGQPVLALHGIARATLDRRGGGRILVSISHERDHALAVVLIAP